MQILIVFRKLFFSYSLHLCQGVEGELLFAAETVGEQLLALRNLAEEETAQTGQEARREEERLLLVVVGDVGLRLVLQQSVIDGMAVHGEVAVL